MFSTGKSECDEQEKQQGYEKLKSKDRGEVEAEKLPTLWYLLLSECSLGDEESLWCREHHGWGQAEMEAEAGNMPTMYLPYFTKDSEVLSI